MCILKEILRAYWQKGDTGDNGEDALILVITSSNGLIFKNTDIATVLTAHVYKGGLELTGSTVRVGLNQPR